MQTYSPSASKTSKQVTCNNTLCDLQNQCSKSSDQCPYNVTYLSEDTSTAGTLVEDVLYLTPGDGSQNGTVVKAPITFGYDLFFAVVSDFFFLYFFRNKD